MNWPRLIGLSLALCLHGGVLYALIAHPGSGALADGSGSDNFTVVAEVSLESADFFTQSKQDAAIDSNPDQAAPPPVPDKPEQKIEPQDKSETAVPLEAPRQEPLPERAQTMTQAASVAAEAQEEQQAAAALAARRNELLSQYSAQLFSALERHKTHIAKTGDVLLEFTVAPSGRLLGHAVIQSSGVPELDRAAIAALERAAPFRPIPADLSSGPLSVTIPFQFRTR
jgi:protein TonB